MTARGVWSFIPAPDRATRPTGSAARSSTASLLTAALVRISPAMSNRVVTLMRGFPVAALLRWLSDGWAQRVAAEAGAAAPRAVIAPERGLQRGRDRARLGR